MAQLSSRYATAFFELAVERGVIDALADQVLIAHDMLCSAQFQNFINHPNISKDEKYKFLDDELAAMFNGSTQAEFNDFLRLLIFKNRENIIVAALNDFIRMARDFKKETTAHVVSASRMSEAQILDLKRELLAKTGKQVDISVEIDPSLIGGFYVKVDGFIIDRSVKKGLSDMKDFVKMAH